MAAVEVVRVADRLMRAGVMLVDPVGMEADLPMVAGAAVKADVLLMAVEVVTEGVMVEDLPDLLMVEAAARIVPHADPEAKAVVHLTNPEAKAVEIVPHTTALMAAGIDPAVAGISNPAATENSNRAAAAPGITKVAVEVDLMGEARAVVDMVAGKGIFNPIADPPPVSSLRFPRKSANICRSNMRRVAIANRAF